MTGIAGASVRRTVVLAGALCLAVAASCGGGGGGGGAGAPRPTTVFDPTLDSTVAVDPTTVLTPIEITMQNDKKSRIEREDDYSGASEQLGLVKASFAYARDATGLGETILIVDDGIIDGHFEFSADGKVGEVSYESLYPEFTAYNLTTADPSDIVHGTYVAAIAAGGRDGAGRAGLRGGRMQGVAYEASIHVAYRCYEDFDPDCPGLNADADFFRRILRIAGEQDAYVANFSFGTDESISDLLASTPEEIRRQLGDTARALEQRGAHPADKVVVVWAAGNEGHDDVHFRAGLGVPFPELRRHVLAVVSVDAGTGAISSFSNHCGIAKAFCLAAPGSGMVIPGDPLNLACLETCYSKRPENQGGTSLAAPMVSGAFALLRQYFRNMLGSTGIAQRLLATADKSGIYSDSDVYGQGLLDLDKATWPVGTVSVPTTSAVAGAADPFAGTRLGMVGTAAGDRVRKAFAGRELAVLDELHAPFFVPLDSLADGGDELPGDARLVLDAPWSSAEVHAGAVDSSLRLGVAPGLDGPRISRLSHHSRSGGHERFLSLRGHPGDFFGPYRDRPAPSAGERRLHSAPFLDLVADGFGAGGSTHLTDGVRLTYGAFRGRAVAPGQIEPAGKRNSGFMTELALADDAVVLQGGHLRESAGVAGLLPQGAMGSFEGDTTFGGIVVQSALGAGWTARASAHAGRSLPRKRRAGIVEGISPLVSSAYSIGLHGGGVLVDDDRLALALSQPMRIEKGSMHLRVPTGRTRYGDVVHESFEAGLEPDARHLDLRATYSRSGRRSSLRLHAGVERHADHIAANGVNPYLQLHWRTTF